MGEDSIAAKTKTFVSGKPFILACLKHDLINFSALARKIIEDENLKENDFEAVVVALRRLSEKAKPSPKAEEIIVKMFRNSSIKINNRIGVAFLEPKIPVSPLAELMNEVADKNETLHIIHGNAAFVVITSNEIAKKIAQIFRSKLIDSKSDLVEITIKTGPEIISTPGAVAFLYSRFSENSINILETLSSWTETILLIEEKDLQKALKVLKF